MSQVQLRRPTAVALDLIVQNRRARLSNRTDPAAGTVAWRSAQTLERLGLVQVIEIVAVATDAGRQLVADGIVLPPRRYEHGTHACYVLDGCRCTPCHQANDEYEQRRAKDLAYGRPRTVDAEPVRTHVRQLMCKGGRGDNRMGVGLKQIAKVSGVAHGALWKLMYGAPDRNGPSRTVRAATAEKLLAVSMADMADGATVDAKPTWRRVNEMVKAGWAKAAIARHVHGPQAAALQLGTDTVTVRNARAIAALHTGWKAGDIPTVRRRSPWPTRRANEAKEAADVA